ncbi:MAG: tripartite tricarboxylate transporter substrate binding protein [Reyranella sp.]|uniref:Bug family tripartite tricarboxylate transporter substrate binding protein n=1 Tax=Reyranella sp. TaxID=1929291 RepID=UPI0011F685E7|nr:tripartite tricarboxylate transporter substrate binding protein [Reyranella sp.]TAJ39001.1 MAG: tripartite tricarboxylate transporter substrate binding protein [Reyranella sp.]
MLRIIALALSAVLLLPQIEAQAQAWPSKPIRFVIPFGAGSATDALSRIVGQELEQTLGQSIIIVPKPGADGALAAGEVKRAASDGYTFMFGTNSPLAVVPNILKEPPYNVLTDFTPVTYLGDNTFFIVVNPAVPARTIAELVAFAKASPTPLNYATGNTYALVSTSMFAKNNGIKLEAVRYKSEPDAMTDLLSGRVQLMNGTATSTLPQVRAGKLRALSTSFPQRSPLMPELPSLVEAGQPPFPIGPWFALVGPAGLPPEIVAAMNKAMAAALAKPSVVAAMQKHGFIPKSSTPAALAAYMKEQLGVWKTALKAAGIEPQ